MTEKYSLEDKKKIAKELSDIIGTDYESIIFGSSELFVSEREDSIESLIQQFITEHILIQIRQVLNAERVGVIVILSGEDRRVIYSKSHRLLKQVKKQFPVFKWKLAYGLEGCGLVGNVKQPSVWQKIKNRYNKT